MKLLRSVSAGLVDSGLASLSTFAIGVYAARFLDAATLGVFALHFAAFTLVATFTHQGLFIPLEALASRSSRGLRYLRKTLALVWAPALVSPLVVLLPVVAAPELVVIPMGLAAAAATFLSPIQDHVRRMLHLGGYANNAVAVSAIQAASVLTGLALLPAYLPTPVVPFAALAVANATSLGYGAASAWSLARKEISGTAGAMAGPALRELLSSGKWLLTAQASASAAVFVAAALVGRLASIETLGVADAARIVGRPILVVTTGLTASLGPRLMRAGASGDEKEGHRVGRVYHLAVAGCVLSFVLAFGWDHAYNPLAWLVPIAFSAPLLVASTVCANGLRGFVLPNRFEAIGAGRTASLLRVDAWASFAHVLVASFAQVLQAYSLAMATAAFALIRGRGLRGVRSQTYGEGPAPMARSKRGPADPGPPSTPTRAAHAS